MRAVTVAPGRAGSARLDDVPEPDEEDGGVLVETVAVGICGTDHEILAGAHGAAPPGRDRIVLGHESLGRVVAAPPGTSLSPGDLTVGIVRRPDPVPCPNCAVGEWDMCSNGRYTERGIRGADGYLAERFRLDPAFAVPVPPALGELGVLVEPASILAKAWEHIEAIGRRARWEPRRVLVAGAGPIGLLAALMAVQRGLELHVLEQVEHGIKPDLVRALGGTYHTGSMAEACAGADVVVECTGVARLVFEAMRHNDPNGIVCLTGVSSGGRRLEVPAGEIARDLVLENDVVFGTVNANRRHYERAVEALVAADRDWLARLVTRRVALEDWGGALQADPVRDIKTVIDLEAEPSRAGRRARNRRM